MDCLLFEREEVQFLHEDEDFIYSFHRFDSGKVTFRRLWPAAKSQECEVVLYPSGEKSIVNIAVIVLYKAVTSGQKLQGFLPDVLKTMVNLYDSKEGLISNLKKAIAAFPGQTRIASVDNIIEFIAPYSLWTVLSYNHNTY